MISFKIPYSKNRQRLNSNEANKVQNRQEREIMVGQRQKTLKTKGAETKEYWMFPHYLVKVLKPILIDADFVGIDEIVESCRLGDMVIGVYDIKALIEGWHLRDGEDSTSNMGIIHK